MFEPEKHFRRERSTTETGGHIGKPPGILASASCYGFGKTNGPSKYDLFEDHGAVCIKELGGHGRSREDFIYSGIWTCENKKGVLSRENIINKEGWEHKRMNEEYVAGKVLRHGGYKQATEGDGAYLLHE